MTSEVKNPRSSPLRSPDAGGSDAQIPDTPRNEGKTLFAASVTVRIAEARVEDVGRALARMAPPDLVRIGARPGDVLQITGRMVAVARAALLEEGEDGVVQIDGTVRANCGAGLQEPVSIARVEHGTAVSVRLASLGGPVGHAGLTPARILEDLEGVALVAGSVVRVPTFAKAVSFQVVRTMPAGPVIVDRRTDVRLVDSDERAGQPPGVSYEDIGGLERELERVREIVELPLKHSRIFERLGILPPKGVLLYGPPGTGKTLLARAVAAESRVHFIHLNGPEIMRKFYGESEAKLREVFEEAARRAPAIIFIDEIDAVAPKRADVVGEVEKRVVAQLLGLMDGFVSRGQVIVLGATNIPEVLDPALRRPGRFDREIELGVPNVAGRLQILRIHTRAMPLAPDVDLSEIAERSHGYVGADLEALCQEVGMIALRRFLSTASLAVDEAGQDALSSLQVTREDVLAGLKEVEPSATREFFIEKATTGFPAVGGLDEVKHLLNAIVEHSHMHDEIYEQAGLTPPRGILLVGPSGTGKTAMARALSGEKGLPLIAIDGPQLFSKWLGESEKALREVFKKARRAAPCILFFDTIDAVAPRLGDRAPEQAGGEPYQRILSQLLREIDNLRDVKGVILIAATNRLERVDAALLRSGRFDYLLRFALPSTDDRRAIFALCCERVPLAPDVDLDELAAQTDAWTGADIESLCKKATLLAIDSFHRAGPGRPGAFQVARDQFLAALGSGHTTTFTQPPPAAKAEAAASPEPPGPPAGTPPRISPAHASSGGRRGA
ncbi:MAG: AAA family ATPase [Acidobacteriota bacterium]